MQSNTFSLPELLLHLSDNIDPDSLLALRSVNNVFFAMATRSLFCQQNRMALAYQNAFFRKAIHSSPIKIDKSLILTAIQNPACDVLGRLHGLLVVNTQENSRLSFEDSKINELIKKLKADDWRIRKEAFQFLTAIVFDISQTQRATIVREGACQLNDKEVGQAAYKFLITILSNISNKKIIYILEKICHIVYEDNYLDRDSLLLMLFKKMGPIFKQEHVNFILNKLLHKLDFNENYNIRHNAEYIFLAMVSCFSPEQFTFILNTMRLRLKAENAAHERELSFLEIVSQELSPDKTTMFIEMLIGQLNHKNSNVRQEIFNIFKKMIGKFSQELNSNIILKILNKVDDPHVWVRVYALRCLLVMMDKIPRKQAFIIFKNIVKKIDKYADNNWWVAEGLRNILKKIIIMYIPYQIVLPANKIIYTLKHGAIYTKNILSKGNWLVTSILSLVIPKKFQPSIMNDFEWAIKHPCMSDNDQDVIVRRLAVFLKKLNKFKIKMTQGEIDLVVQTIFCRFGMLNNYRVQKSVIRVLIKLISQFSSENIVVFSKKSLSKFQGDCESHIMKAILTKLLPIFTKDQTSLFFQVIIDGLEGDFFQKKISLKMLIFLVPNLGQPHMLIIFNKALDILRYKNFPLLQEITDLLLTIAPEINEVQIIELVEKIIDMAHTKNNSTLEKILNLLIKIVPHLGKGAREIILFDVLSIALNNKKPSICTQALILLSSIPIYKFKKEQIDKILKQGLIMLNEKNAPFRKAALDFLIFITSKLTPHQIDLIVNQVPKMLNDIDWDVRKSAENLLSYLIVLKKYNLTQLTMINKNIASHNILLHYMSRLFSNSFDKIPDKFSHNSQTRSNHGQDVLNSDNLIYGEVRQGLPFLGYTRDTNYEAAQIPSPPLVVRREFSLV